MTTREERVRLCQEGSVVVVDGGVTAWKLGPQIGGYHTHFRVSFSTTDGPVLEDGVGPLLGVESVCTMNVRVYTDGEFPSDSNVSVHICDPLDWADFALWVYELQVEHSNTTPRDQFDRDKLERLRERISALLEKTKPTQVHKIDCDMDEDCTCLSDDAG